MSKDKFYIKKDLVIQEVENEIFIFDGDESILHSLNGTAAEIFNKIKKGATVEQLIKFLSNKYKISDKKASQDSLEFISKLEKKNLLMKQKTKKT